MSEPIAIEHAVPIIDKIGPALLDAVYVVNRDGHFLSFNRVLHAMLPRAIARRLKSGTVADIITLKRAGQEFDLIGECIERGQLIRYDEIQAEIKQRDRELTVKVSAMPMSGGPESEVAAVMVTLRDVTDEGQVQQKYQHMLEEETRKRADLQEKIEERTKELMETRDELNVMQAELMTYRKGLKL